MKTVVSAIFCIAIVFISNLVKAQTEKLTYKKEYCILRIVYGSGVGSTQKGVFIVYEDLNVERYELKEISHEYLLKVTMDFTTMLKNKGYDMITTSHSSSITGDVYEYVFKKE